MFAVKGWSVSADKPKPESEHGATQVVVTKSRKRRRSGPAPQMVTTDNVADLWDQFIEKKSGQSEKKRRKLDSQAKPKDESVMTKAKKAAKKERRKQNQESKSNAAQSTAKTDQLDEEEWGGLDDEPTKTPEHNGVADNSGPHETSKKEATGQGDRKSRKGTRNAEAGPGGSKPDKQAIVAVTARAEVKLTPLQAAMRQKLVSARFRHLNETLYTKPSSEAFSLFQESPEMFSEYHQGFRRQVEVWPENPVDGYIAEVKARGKVRDNRKHASTTPRPGSLPPLPRTDGTCTIADLGCGDAALAAALQPVQRKLRLAVRSFDLCSQSPLVTRADIANLPLPDASIDVAVFCLALMGTNWTDFVEEAYRVLKWKGELWVAEIKSRFAAPKAGGGKRVVDHSVGNRKKGLAARVAGSSATRKGTGAGIEHGDESVELNEAELAVEVDGADGPTRETDVSAFVDALRKRGFLLRGESDEAVNLSNKMFVKMSFLKAAPATRGKCATKSRDMRTQATKKFITREDDDAEAPEREAAILKPCMYKLR